MLCAKIILIFADFPLVLRKIKIILGVIGEIAKGAISQAESIQDAENLKVLATEMMDTISYFSKD